jgi:hypothetical protein
MKENRIDDPENPNVAITQKIVFGALETIREVISSTGEIDITTDEDIRKTEETITIIRTTIHKIS